ncbi:hypothetical protein ACET3X_005725 [Alternaria dauci]|uniref:Uncharacterized protein n=1 Tax=Alternaria dauci TaxID=48095 RepID=A0ABR3UJ02_9PLEO
MAARPQVPAISTDIRRDSVNPGRMHTESPHASTPFVQSPARTESMSSRVGKRPLDSHSRGQSPPDKRSRLPDPPSALQDRYANSEGFRIPSPPPSRKSSFARLTNTSTGPKLASDQYRPEHAQRYRRQNVRVLSPGSIGSGASTPTHHAPPTPSMLPATDLSTLRRSAEATSSATDHAPMTMQSLHKLKERKRAIAHQMTASISKTLAAKLATQAMDIAYLKKERDQIIGDREKGLDRLKTQLSEDLDQTKRKLDDVEIMAARFPSLMDRTETLKLINAAAKPLTDRLEALEKSATELPNLNKELQDLAAVPNRLAALESRPIVVQPTPEQNELNVLVKSELKSLTDRLNSLEAADSALAKVPKLENNINTLKNAKELQKIDIDTLKAWKDAQPKAVSEESMKNLIMTEVSAKASILSATLRDKADESTRKLAERITKNETSARDSHTQLAALQDFKAKIEKQKLADQLSVLYEKVKTVEGNDAKTYAKADKLQQQLEELEDECGEYSRLFDKVQAVREEVKTMKKDFASLEKDFSAFEKAVSDQQEDIVKYVGRIKGDYKDTGESLSERVAALRTTVRQADLNRLPIRLSELEKSERNLDRLTTRVDELEKLSPRVDELERAPKGPSFRKVGTPVLSSSVPNNVSPASIESKVDAVDKSLQQFRKTVTGKNSLTSRVDSQDQRLDCIEASSASARPLETVEKTVETTGDGALDETVKKAAEKAVEKAVEKRAKMFVTEREAVERNLEELETRLMEEIRASRNQTHSSKVTSTETITAPPAQSDVNAINDIQRDLDTIFEKLDYQDSIVSTITDSVPGLFQEHFDPFKARVEEQMGRISTMLDKHRADIIGLTEKVEHPPTEENAFGEQQQAQLDAVVVGEATLMTRCAALETSLSTKAEAEKTAQQLQGITFALNNLQSRYENISTDDIYKRMVDWFARMYPNFTQILDDVTKLKATKNFVDHYANFIACLSRDGEQLSGLISMFPHLRELATVTLHLKNLVNMAPQLETLASSTMQLQSLIQRVPQLEELARSNDLSPQDLARLEKACSNAHHATTKAEQACSNVQYATTQAEQASSNASSAIKKAEQASSDAMTANTKADQAASEVQAANAKIAEIEQRLIEEVNTLENLDSTVKALQKSLHGLNSEKSSFANAGALGTVQQTMNTLQSQLELIRKERVANLGQLRSSLSEGLRARASAENEMRKSINSLNQTTNNLNQITNNLNQTINSDKTLYAKTEALDGLKKILDTLQSELKTDRKARSAHHNKLAASVATEAGKIATLEKETKQHFNKVSTIEKETKEHSNKISTLEKEAKHHFNKISTLERESAEYFNELRKVKNDYEAAVPELQDQLVDIQRADAELRTKIDTTFKAYIEPNRSSLGLLDSLFMVISQIQQIVDSLNQNLPVKPLEFEWQCNFSKLGPATTNGEPSNSKGKGKSMQ